MAKKVAGKQAEEGVFVGRNGKKYFANSGPARKQCPKCLQFVPSAATGICNNPDCDHEFQQKAKTSEAKTTRPRQLATSDFAGQLFADTVETLQKVKAYAKDFGGVDKLADKLDAFEEITMQTGGIDGLRKALEALKQL